MSVGASVAVKVEVVNDHEDEGNLERAVLLKLLFLCSKGVPQANEVEWASPRARAEVVRFAAPMPAAAVLFKKNEQQMKFGVETINLRRYLQMMAVRGRVDRPALRRQGRHLVFHLYGPPEFSRTCRQISTTGRGRETDGLTKSKQRAMQELGDVQSRSMAGNQELRRQRKNAAAERDERRSAKEMLDDGGGEGTNGGLKRASGRHGNRRTAGSVAGGNGRRKVGPP
ncbi:MAG: hypothetical protein M1824_001518 [Vezdaea acicularis]|nr:MAG: hypothetical protein M1824_001518 [Vezdaea acicularis]